MNKIKDITGRVFFPVNKKNNDYFPNAYFLDEIRCLNKYEKFFYFARNIHLSKVIQKIYNVGDYDFILAHSLFSNGLLAMTISKKYNIPYAVIITNTDMNFYFRKLFYLRNTGLKILKNADKIVFSSESYYDKLIETYVPNKFKKDIKKNSLVIPFGVDKFWIENRKMMQEKELKDSVKLLYVGKINQNKNLLLTLKACNMLINKGIDVKYTVVGDPSHKKDISILKKLLSYNFVKHFSTLPFHQLIKHYRANDIFVMPSITESFGLVYAEAMTQGMPIIYTKGQGFDKQFEDKVVGIPIDPFSVDDLVNAIKYIMKNYNQMAKAAYENSYLFSWNLIVARFLKGLELV